MCATRANIRHFNNLIQTCSNHRRLLTPDKYLPWRPLCGQSWTTFLLFIRIESSHLENVEHSHHSLLAITEVRMVLQRSDWILFLYIFTFPLCNLQLQIKRMLWSSVGARLLAKTIFQWSQNRSPQTYRKWKGPFDKSQQITKWHQYGNNLFSCASWCDMIRNVQDHLGCFCPNCLMWTSSWGNRQTRLWSILEENGQDSSKMSMSQDKKRLRTFPD